MEASTVVVGGNEDMIETVRTVPEGEAPGDEIHGGGNERASMVEGGEAIDGREVTGDVDRDEEVVGLKRVNGASRRVKQGLVEGDLGGEEVGGAARAREPCSIELRRQIVDVDLKGEGSGGGAGLGERSTGDRGREEGGGGGGGEEEVEGEGEPEDPAVVFLEELVVMASLVRGAPAMEELLHIAVVPAAAEWRRKGEADSAI